MYEWRVPKCEECHLEKKYVHLRATIGFSGYVCANPRCSEYIDVGAVTDAVDELESESES
jgi:hypothetical protein